MIYFKQLLQVLEKLLYIIKKINNKIIFHKNQQRKLDQIETKLIFKNKNKRNKAQSILNQVEILLIIIIRFKNLS